MVTHFYHWYASGAWTAPVREHFAALSAVRFPGQVNVGLVGSPADRNVARERLVFLWPGAEICAEADTGYEEVTLSVLRSWALSAAPTSPVLYAHTKGAYNQGPLNARWREGMTSVVVGQLEACVASLAEADAVGCNWLSAETVAGYADRPCFGGNFWWATAGYAATLSEPTNTSRYDAEAWIGTGHPKVRVLGQPGWPTY